ncbi:MAG: hypothetical protein ABSC19_06015 [Syntrophorhabdales bacterium]|jgi:drug/metabolite transporter (DMT)-like permease
MKRFLWALVGNDENDVSTGAVLGILVVVSWVAAFIWAQHTGDRLKVSPSEILLLAGGLMAIPKASALLGKKGGNNAPANNS